MLIKNVNQLKRTQQVEAKTVSKTVTIKKLSFIQEDPSAAVYTEEKDGKLLSYDIAKVSPDGKQVAIVKNKVGADDKHELTGVKRFDLLTYNNVPDALKKEIMSIVTEKGESYSKKEEKLMVESFLNVPDVMKFLLFEILTSNKDLIKDPKAQEFVLKSHEKLVRIVIKGIKKSLKEMKVESGFFGDIKDKIMKTIKNYIKPFFDKILAKKGVKEVGKTDATIKKIKVQK